MNPSDLQLVCDSLDRALEQESEFGEEFYRQLTSDHPELMAVFQRVNMKAQHMRFAGMLRIIIHRLNAGRSVESLLRDLGRQHRQYGVSIGDFDKFGESLIQVILRLGCGDSNNLVAKAWQSIFNDIADRMISAMKDPVCPLSGK